jgi:hypothetical protein
LFRSLALSLLKEAIVVCEEVADLAYASGEGEVGFLKDNDGDDDELKEQSRLARLAVPSRPVFS